MKKIVIISNNFPNKVSGVGDYTYYLSIALAGEGFDIYVITSRYEDLKIDDRIKIFPIVKNWNLFCIFKIIWQIQKVKPNFINFQYVPYAYNYYGMPLYLILLFIIFKVFGFKTINTFHEFAIRLDLEKPKYWIVGIAQRLTGYAIAFLSNKIIVTIEYNKRKLRSFIYKMKLIPIGSNIIPVEISEYEKKELRKKIAPNNEFIISTFGTLQPNRREDKVLPIIKRYINEKHAPSIKMLFIGSTRSISRCPIEGLCKDLEINESIHFTGYLNNEEVYKFLAITDTFIFLDIDGKGRGGMNTKSGCVAAAYAANLPIVGYRGDLTGVFFKHMDNVFLINNVSGDAIIGAIKELINNKTLREKLKEGARKSYQSALDWTIIGEQYGELINKEM